MTRIHFSQELESVRQDLIQMGETTVSLLGEVLHAVSGDGSASAERASELEARTDHQLRTIHDECLSLITLQAPVARDARLITGILDAIVDLELIGDYCYEIVTICGTTKHRAPSPIVHQVSEIVSGIRSALLTALGGWDQKASPDLSVAPQVVAIRGECKALYEKLSQLAAAPVDAMPYVNLLLICRHLDRIARHVACVAEQAANAAPATRN